jgi:hypothetical protein
MLKSFSQRMAFAFLAALVMVVITNSKNGLANEPEVSQSAHEELEIEWAEAFSNNPEKTLQGIEDLISQGNILQASAHISFLEGLGDPRVKALKDKITKAAVDKENARNEQQENMLKKKKALDLAKISEWAVSDIDKKSYPKTYAAWGPEWVKKLNKMQHQAAEKVSGSPNCDRVDLVALSDFRSKPRQKAVFFADCANGERFYISDTDLNDNSAAVSKQAITNKITDASAIDQCREAVRSQMNYPSTFKSSILNNSVYRAPGGNVAVNLEFKVKNGFGAELPMQARCIFDDQGMNAPEITNR